MGGPGRKRPTIPVLRECLSRLMGSRIGYPCYVGGICLKPIGSFGGAVDQGVKKKEKSTHFKQLRVTTNRPGRPVDRVL